MNTPIDPLSGFRPDGYGLDDERRARMRARVLDAIPDEPPVAAASVATLATPRPVELPLVRTGADAIDATEPDDLHVLEPISLDDRRPSSRSARSRRSSNGRRLLAAAAVAIALGLLAVVVGTSRSSDRQVGTLDQSSPDVTLDQLAAGAAALPDQPLAPGQYQQVELTTAERSADGYDLTITRTWHTTDGSGRSLTSTMVRPAGALPGAETGRVDNPAVPDPVGTEWFGPFSYDVGRGALTDPGALLDQLTAAMGNSPKWAIAEQIMAIESLTSTPPALRAAGLRALGELGFTPIGVVTDPLGRPGVGFSLDTPEGTEVLAFAEHTGKALGYWSAAVGSATTVESADRWGAFGHDAITDTPN